MNDIDKRVMAITDIADKALDDNKELRSEIERLRETVVSLYHEDPKVAGTSLHEFLGMTWDEYRLRANSSAREPARTIDREASDANESS